MTRENCNCYVQGLPDYERFAIRDGAHDPNACPVWRMSRDDVDWEKDKAVRAMYLRAMCTHPNHYDESSCAARMEPCHVDCWCCKPSLYKPLTFVASDGYADGGEAYVEDELKLLNAWR